ncbi:MAG: hypothetical protein AAFX87_07630 [Bacteroidota bacterium]
MAEWQKVFSSPNLHRAEIVKAILEEAGLNPVLINRQDSSYKDFGSFEIRVAPDFVIKAFKIIGDDISFT